MMRRTFFALACFATCLALQPIPLILEAAAQAPRAAQKPARSDPFGNFGGNSKEPIRIDANKLEVFEKDQRAVYTGDVVAVRGTTITRATQMTIFYDNKKNNTQPANMGQSANNGAVRSASAGANPAGQDGALKRIEFKGPVSVVNGTQTATSNELIYDAIGKKVILRGNAVVTDGPNVQRGELMTYDTEASTATITNPGGRVQGVFTPGSEEQGKNKDKKAPRAGQQPTN
jgi:lipopolysaccharide export system protein LptA